MKPMSFLRLACQRSTHPFLYFLRQRPTEVSINTPHHRERIAMNLNIIDVANAMLCQYELVPVKTWPVFSTSNRSPRGKP